MKCLSLSDCLSRAAWVPTQSTSISKFVIGLVALIVIASLIAAVSLPIILATLNISRNILYKIIHLLLFICFFYQKKHRHQQL